ncbi:prepilin peptidase [Brachybacterium phenoliresistens]|uniref:Prepilin type IV endopeptidase peptidase domain-containing protein n=1 Tax=Brachybacterium phenoliresistens TaxID=396014 RepID=Z9JWX3_9MICO|nr:prepilin peptidase [Brachybacterium phenoliresistens]EWS82684.1 hypothetical protein BF93_06575 [Brachybacterium phenoliresistens]
MPSPELPALCVLLLVFCPQAVALAWIDGREHRLPNRRVALLTGSTAAALGLLAVLRPDLRSPLGTAAVLALVCAVAGIGVALLAPQLIGMGDAKTAPVVVLMSATLGPYVLVAAVLGVLLLAGAAGAAAWAVTRRADARFAVGPVLLAGPFLGLLASPLVAVALGSSAA